MKLELVDLKYLPSTNLLDGTPIYTHPIKPLRKFFIKRIELSLSLLEPPNGNVLDIGCGSGILLPTLSKIRGMVVGVDIHANLDRVNNYLKKNGFRNLHLIRADNHYLPFRNSCFIAILAISTLDHLDKPRLAIQEIDRIGKFGLNFVFGLHITHRFNFLIEYIWNSIWIVTYLMSWHSTKKVIKALINPKRWRHKYTHSILIRWIVQRFELRQQNFLGKNLPIYLAALVCKEKKSSYYESKI